MSMNKNYAWGSIAAVVVTLIIGLILSGSPGNQRQVRFDADRVSDLKRLTYSIERHREDHSALPASLEQMVDGRGRGSGLDALPRDPETDMVYVYSIVSENSYRLCAEFSQASEQQAQATFWDHQAGYYCYEIILPEKPAQDK